MPITVSGSLNIIRSKLLAISATVKYRKWIGWLPFQSDEQWLYESEQDDRVCFPKNTMITTKKGRKKIQDIKNGTIVLTDAGWNSVLHCHKNKYSGDMTFIKTETRILLCTSNHPLHNNFGWKNASQLRAGEFLKTSDNKAIKITYVKNFSLFKPDNIPSMSFKKVIPSTIFNWIMPIFSINLKSNPSLLQGKVNRISSYLKLLNKRYANFFKTLSESFLKQGFALKRTIARKTTKLSSFLARAPSKLFSAVSTCYNNGWSSTNLTTIMSIESLFSPKYFSTPFALNIFCGGSSTLDTTNVISVSNRCKNDKLLTTDRTRFSGFLRSVETLPRAKHLISASKYNNKYLSTLRASFINAMSPRKTITWHTTILSWAHTSICFVNKLLSTIITGCNYHRLTLPIKLSHFYKGYIHVYNLSVSERPTFFANGVLVHNCPVCQGFEAQQYYAGNAILHNFPTEEQIEPLHYVHPRVHEAHPELRGQCRCSLTWIDPIRTLRNRLENEMREAI